MTMRTNRYLVLVAAVVIAMLTTACSSGSGGKPGADTRVPDITAELPGAADVATDVPSGDVAEVVAPPPEYLPGYVEPMIGTGGLSYRLGSVFVGATVPFGLAKLGPDTKHETWGEPGFTHCEGYFYPDTHVAGFSHLHIHGTGAPDYASLLVQPSIGMDESKVTEEGYMLPLDHDKEHNEPGYYSINMGFPGINAELTATTRVGVHRYKFPTTEEAVIIVDPSHEIASCDVDDSDLSIDADAGTFEGWLHTGCSLSGRFGGYKMFFYGEFRRQPTDGGVWQDNALVDGAATGGPEAGAWFQFDATSDKVVELAVGLSFVDVEHARDNVSAEVGDTSFDEILAAVREQWNQHLGLAKVHFPEDTPNDVRIQYYTSLYHAMLMPTIWSESDGKYLAFDGSVKIADGFTFYTDFSMWDTYRNLHPLLFLLAPERSEDMIRSLLEMADIHQCLPKWVLANGDGGSMIGRPASIIVADAWLHGLPIADENDMYRKLLNSHAVAVDGETIPDCSGGDGYHTYTQYGYHPYDLEGGSVSKTQEIAWADYCVGKVAEEMGKEDDSLLFYQRSLNPYNLYNPETGFFMAKDSGGEWHPKFVPTFFHDYYTEGNAWQYLWLVPHDAGGLAEMLGGGEDFFARLDEFFDETKAWESDIAPPEHYFMGNEPDMHAPFLYSAMGRPASSAEWSRWIMDKEFYVDPEGLSGNDDAGTMAAWYAFTTLGFYPIPCTERYMLGSPRVSEAWLNSLGTPLHILVENPSESRPFIESVTWNGEPVTTPWFTIEQLKAGGELVFTMSAEPTDFGTGDKFVPLAEQYPLD